MNGSSFEEALKDRGFSVSDALRYPDSRAAGVFPTAWGALQSAKTALLRWVGEVLGRV